ncbi:MAG: winged helix-turn-helix domain-containing protein [Vicinamibacterales bacterium]
MPSELDPVYLFGPFRVSVASLELFRDGQPLSLPPKTFDTLVLLLTHHQRVVTKEELLKSVWREAFVSDDSLSQCISGLRKALGDDPNQPQFIATIPRRGYRFIGPVRVEGASAPAEATPTPAPPGPVALPPPAGQAGAPAVLRRLSPWPFLVTALASLGVGVALTLWLAEKPERPLRLNLQPPIGTSLSSGAVLSPDGTRAAYVAEEGRSGRRQLWVAALEGGEPRVLPDTDGADQPFWSPDSRALGFFAGGALKTVPVDSGAAQTIATLGFVPAGASWSDSGTIAFASFRSAIHSIAATGGRISSLSTIDTAQGDLAHEWPHFLPGGTQFLFTIDSANPDRAGTYVASVSGGEPRRLVPDPHGIYAAPGYLVFVRDRALMAQRFDPARLTLSGTPATVVGSVSAPSLRNDATISASTGLLTFGGASGGGRLVWIDRNGQQVGVVNAPGEFHNPALMSDGQRVLVDGNGVWAADLYRGTATRLVQDGSMPIPSPDGTMLLFNAVRESGIADLYVRAIDGTNDELLFHSTENVLPNDWTRDGQFIVYVSRNPERGRDIWLLPMQAPRTPVPFARGRANEIQAQVSPDGKWIAYASDESGAYEVYVEAFPKGGSKRAVSSGGGAKPQWRADGRELFYLSVDRLLMAAPVDEFGEIAKPQELFQAPVVADLSTYRSQFVPSHDGQRFLVDAADPASSREPITVLVNWTGLVAGR